MAVGGGRSRRNRDAKTVSQIEKRSGAGNWAVFGVNQIEMARVEGGSGKEGKRLNLRRGAVRAAAVDRSTSQGETRG
jgi:hypothetical protein